MMMLAGEIFRVEGDILGYHPSGVYCYTGTPGGKTFRVQLPTSLMHVVVCIPFPLEFS